jgi:hypothetical protein
MLMVYMDDKEKLRQALRILRAPPSEHHVSLGRSPNVTFLLPVPTTRSPSTSRKRRRGRRSGRRRRRRSRRRRECCLPQDNMRQPEMEGEAKPSLHLIRKRRRGRRSGRRRRRRRRRE